MQSRERHSKRMKQVMLYIETHLDDNPTLTELSRQACYSEFHFQRLFQTFIGETVHSYKRRLLLERAISQLRYSQSTITDIALKCGFETASAFNKAFKSRFSFAPSQVRLHQDLTLKVTIQKIIATV